jgi:Holliday junction DNA helicase RuvA
MIARLRGNLISRRGDRIVVDVGGVGYEVAVSSSTIAVLPDVGGEVVLLVHTHVAEDILALYGFATEGERDVFELLLSVAGVGRSTALAILSGMPTADLIEAIAQGDVRRLTAIRGVGKKTAERLVLELKDKMAILGAAAQMAERRPLAAVPPSSERPRPPAVSALVRLGFREVEAELAVQRAQAALGTEGAEDAAALLREALRRAEL